MHPRDFQERGQFAVDLSFRYGELLRVELHRRRRRGDGDFDGSSAVEGVVVQSEC